MSTRQPGSKVKLPNPLLFKVVIDPDKLAADRGPYRYFTARRTETGASSPLNARGITLAALPTTGAPATILGRKGDNKLATA